MKVYGIFNGRRRVGGDGDGEGEGCTEHEALFCGCPAPGTCVGLSRIELWRTPSRIFPLSCEN